jgi:hypothetical protein
MGAHENSAEDKPSWASLLEDFVVILDKPRRSVMFG